jgi:hypothetical protein
VRPLLTREEKIVQEGTINFELPLEMVQMLAVERMRLLEVTRTQAFSVTGLAQVLKRSKVSTAECAEVDACGCSQNTGADQFMAWTKTKMIQKRQWLD